MVRIRIRLSTLLGERRIKQSQLARRTGITPATIWRYYNEDIERISLNDLAMICEALGCELKDLIYSEEVGDGTSAISDYAWERRHRPKRRRK